jgi:hypothetical protein
MQTSAQKANATSLRQLAGFWMNGHKIVPISLIKKKWKVHPGHPARKQEKRGRISPVQKGTPNIWPPQQCRGRPRPWSYLQQNAQGTLSGRKYGCSSPSKSPSWPGGLAIAGLCAGYPWWTWPKTTTRLSSCWATTPWAEGCEVRSRSQPVSRFDARICSQQASGAPSPKLICRGGRPGSGPSFGALICRSSWLGSGEWVMRRICILVGSKLSKRRIAMG